MENPKKDNRVMDLRREMKFITKRSANGSDQVTLQPAYVTLQVIYRGDRRSLRQSVMELAQRFKVLLFSKTIPESQF